MYSTTDAIVLSLQPHSDKAHVLHAYTRAGGRVNYMVYGLGKKNAAGKYTPLSIVQLTTDDRSVRNKRAIALFISEVLFHVLRHPMQDEPLYDFITQAITELDSTSEPQNFHLLFLSGFAAKLGFAMPEQDTPLPTTRAERQKQLLALCRYFEEHVETWQNPRSLDVLMEVFD